jgi:hypothetical protein
VNDSSWGSSQVIRQKNLSTNSFTPTTPLTVGHQYTAWVEAFNSNGQTGGWSQALSFSIAATIPPTFSAPADPSSSLPTFSWSASPGAVRYDLWVDDSTAGISQVIRQPNLGTNAFTPTTALTIGHMYRAWVEAFNSSGQTGGWSQAYSFSVVATVPPTLTAPPGSTTATTPTFTWTASSGATSYELWLADNTAGILKVLDQLNLTTTSFIPASALAVGHQYSAWVQAFNSSGQTGGWSQPLVFTVQNVNYVPPTAAFTNGGPVTLGQTATVSFSGATGGNGTYTYSYDFNNDSTFEITNTSLASASVPASYLNTVGAHVIHGRITDPTGGGFTDYTTTITVNTPPGPAVTTPANASAIPGVSTAFALGSFSDPGANDGPWTVKVNWGDSSTPATFTATTQGALNATHTYASVGTFTATVTVTNQVNQSSSGSITVAVAPPGDNSSPYIVTPYDNIPNFGAHPTVRSAQSGAWSNPSTWSTGVVPAAGDIVSIEPNMTVTYDVVSTAAVNTVIIQNTGSLVFRTDISTELMVVNLLVLQGGTLQVGTQSNPVAAGVTAQIVFANQPLNLTGDPSQYGNGLIALGTVTVYGASKNQTWIPLAANAPAGATTLTLAQPATGWQAGDTLYLPDSQEPDVNGQVNGQPYVAAEEKVTLASVSADGLTLTLASPLQHPHAGVQNASGTWFLPDVADMTRNVSIHSQSASGTRGYTLFTGRANVDIEYATLGGLGRETDVQPDNTTYDANGNVTHAGTNEANRNAVTFLHLIGPTTPQSDGYQYTFLGNVVTCPLNPMPFRWGINIYDSDYGLIKNNVVVNWEGAGIVALTGSETDNVIADNFVAQISGEGDRADSRSNHDLGFEGSAFWFGGFNNYVNNNVATDCSYAGYTYYANRDGAGVKVPTSQGADYSQYVTVYPSAVPILQFSNDQAYGPMAVGLTIWALGASFSQPYAGMAPSTVAGYTAWHLHEAYYGYEASKLTLDHLTALDDASLQNNPNNATVALYFSDYLTDNLTVNHADIEGFKMGYDGSPNASGTITIENSYFENVINIAVQTASGGGSNGLSDTLLPRTTLINNDVFVPIPNYQGGLTQLNVVMEYMTITGQANLIVSDTVYVTNYNGVTGDSFQVFYAQQDASFVMPQTNGHMLIGAPVAGLTNAQAWAQYGIAIAGALAPSNTTTRQGIGGLVLPD